MKKIINLIFIYAFAVGCNNSDRLSGKAENDVDAATMFVRSALNGNYKEAQKLIVPDSTNLQGLANAERLYLNSDINRQRGLRESTIHVHDTKKLNDSVSIVEYSNSFTNQHQALKAVKLNGDWLIDFKYTFQKPDSTAK